MRGLKAPCGVGEAKTISSTPATLAGTMFIIAEEGYDAVFGARPLKRVIQRFLQDPLAEMILAGDVAHGHSVAVTAKADGLIIGDKLATSERQPPKSAVLH